MVDKDSTLYSEMLKIIRKHTDDLYTKEHSENMANELTALVQRIWKP